MNKDYLYFDKTFEINSYDRKKTFASFLPGLAGKKGIPLWAFYVNRGQGVSSFGIRDKNGAILEFYPANLAYMYVSKIGFRTFIKVNGVVHEFFDNSDQTQTRKMHITQSSLKIIEENHTLGLSISVTYFGLPNEDIAALTRLVEIKNVSKEPISFEVLDGLAQILPSGVDYGGYKAISNLLRSWMNVENLDKKIAFYKLRSSIGDEAETKETKSGNFYATFVNHKIVLPITDMDLVFGYDTSLNFARSFEEHTLEELLLEPQVTENKIPCGFTPVIKKLNVNESIQIETLIGYTSDINIINHKLSTFQEKNYFTKKQVEAKLIIDELLDDVLTTTNYPLFDEYIRQSYLDNLIRGGYPLTIETTNENFVYYLYSRKHGDLERDYNFFSIAPEFYSQGNGNFRDVCQNRRNDILFHPEIDNYNIHVFASLIQADGFNPLGINGSTFQLKNPTKAKELIQECFLVENKAMEKLLDGKFTPGSIINLMHQENLSTKLTDESIFNKIFSLSFQNIEASFNEGYWVDHWTYLLDLIENYDHIFPDRNNALLYGDSSYTYFNSPASVYPRSEKYVKDRFGKIRQYGALHHPDKEVINTFEMNEHGTNWLKLKDKSIIKATLYSKLFVLAINKFALLDPLGIGLEMEANKPGWNDAMNGLPGLFASGISETIELARLVDYLLKHIDTSKKIVLPISFVTFFQNMEKADDSDAFIYWDSISTLREIYRETLRTPIERMVELPVKSLLDILNKMQKKLKRSLQQALDLGKGIIPTYLYYEADDYEVQTDKSGQPIIGHYGLPLVHVKHFTMKKLPLFLEAPARFLKYNSNLEQNSTLVQKVKNSGIYDKKLKMYKTSENLDKYGYEIGRIRAFTKGWLEREANFLHMTYKYLLGILKSGQIDAFFEEARDNLVCFMDPEIYGRSTLENSSFIATSNNPNPNLHGQGFVSRLSGSTAEIISIWSVLLYGKEIFTYEDNTLRLKLKPLLTADFFKDDIVVTTFMHTSLLYYNPNHLNGFDCKIEKYELTDYNGYITLVSSEFISDTFAENVRNGLYKLIKVYLV
ncbi:MAG: cellobiose phosphorylase [Firmicutes bacterium]|nr:cellobiose phosphorylase [Bacillota bacterium]